MFHLFRTDEGNRALLIQRLLLGLVIFPHGAQKLFGWFGGYGFSGTMNFFTGTMHLPSLIALLVILIESIGAVLLALGLLSRLAAAGVSAVMVGAVVTSHLSHGFFMNWFGNQQGEGFEFHLLALALAIPIVIWGGGAAALDSAIFQRFPLSVALPSPAARRS
jgi:putative oxidoreductase